MRLLDRINRTGTTVVMATHDHSIVDQMRRRVIELDRARSSATRRAASTAWGGSGCVPTSSSGRSSTGLRRNVTMTIAMVLTTAISLGLVGTGLLAVRTIDRTEELYSDRVEVQVALTQDVSAADADCSQSVCSGLRATLESSPLVDVGALREPAAGLRALQAAVRRPVAGRRGAPAVAAGDAAGEAGRPGGRRRRGAPGR